MRTPEEFVTEMYPDAWLDDETGSIWADRSLRKEGMEWLGDSWENAANNVMLSNARNYSPAPEKP